MPKKPRENCPEVGQQFLDSRRKRWLFVTEKIAICFVDGKKVERNINRGKWKVPAYQIPNGELAQMWGITSSQLSTIFMEYRRRAIGTLQDQKPSGRIRRVSHRNALYESGRIHRINVA